MLKSRKGFLVTAAVALPLFLGPVSGAQYNRQYNNNGYNNNYRGSGNRDFYNGARQGGRGGYYDHGNDYNNGRGDRYQGHGIGTGRGALIGGAGGAALGAIFGGGLKGALIGGGAGAGIGAIAGHEHQKTVRRHDYERSNGYYPR